MSATTNQGSRLPGAAWRQASCCGKALTAAARFTASVRAGGVLPIPPPYPAMEGDTDRGQASAMIPDRSVFIAFKNPKTP